MKIKNKHIKSLVIAIYFVFILSSFVIGFEPGKQIGHNFISFSIEMLKLFPCAFIMIGLFEVWVKKESVEKQLGKESGMLSYFWIMLLAGITIGGLVVAFPVAYSLFKKGAKLSIIFSYIGASAVCRVPMTIFETSFMGIKFSLIRLIVSIPLIILSSIWLEKYLEKRNYRIMEGK